MRTTLECLQGRQRHMLYLELIPAVLGPEMQVLDMLVHATLQCLHGSQMAPHASISCCHHQPMLHTTIRVT